MPRRLLGLSILAALGLCVTPLPEARAIDIRSDDLLALYRFDETSGVVAVNSAAPGASDAQQNQGSIGWTTTGRIGGALELNGSSSLTAPDVIGADATAFTLSAWINADSANGYDGIYSTRDVNWGLNLEGNDGSTRHVDYRFANADNVGSTGIDSADNSIANGVWYHLALTWTADGANNNVFLNGVDIGDSNSNVATTYEAFDQTWNIGDDPCCNGRELDGRIDDLAVWGVALSASEIGSIYQAGLAGNGLDTPLLGDANGDGLVTNADFEVILANFGRNGDAEGVTLSRAQGDLVNDNVIDFLDFGQWKQVSPKDAAAAAFARLVGVPEPTSACLLGLAAAATTRRRR